MSWKRLLAVGVLSMGIGVVPQPVRAEDPPAPAGDAAPAPKDAPKKKDPFFGDRFAMYVETRGGPATIDTIDNSVESGFKSKSVNTLDFSDSKSGQFTIGWTLPRGRGQYVLTYTGIEDGKLELDATGMQVAYQCQSCGTTPVIGFQLPWWNISIRDGHLTSTKTPPVWNSLADDADGDGFPDIGEFRFPTTTDTIAGTVPESLDNSLQTWDLYYRREFGGVRIRARWTAGLRYLNFDGAIATPAWVTGPSSTAGLGFTDGAAIDLIMMQQSTKGWGPLGSGEVQFNFFRQRLTLYMMAQAALLLETLDTDSGPFTYLAKSPSSPNVPVTYFMGSGRIDESVSKTSWNTTFEAGVRFRVLEGFHIFLDWNTTGYLDTMLLPVDLSVPDLQGQVASGTNARFVSRDFVVSQANLGLSFQF